MMLPQRIRENDDPLTKPSQRATKKDKPMRDPWDERYIYLHEKHKNQLNVGTGMSMEVIVTIVSKLVHNLLTGLTTYLYRGYDLFTKYHGHPSKYTIHGSVMGFDDRNVVLLKPTSQEKHVHA